MESPARRIDPLPLLVALALPLAVGALGGAATSSSVRTWYPTLRKPPFNPPGWVFGPVWTVLYLLMGIAIYLVWTGSESPSARSRVATAWRQPAQKAFSLLPSRSRK